MRDLLALDVDVISMLPGDEAGHGFDNVTVGNLSPTLLERYLRAAQKISRLAIGIARQISRARPHYAAARSYPGTALRGIPPGYPDGHAANYTFPQDAEYDFVVRLQRDRNEHVEDIAASTMWRSCSMASG